MLVPVTEIGEKVENYKSLNIMFVIVLVAVGLFLNDESWITRALAFVPIFICYLLASIWLALGDIHRQLVVLNSRSNRDL